MIIIFKIISKIIVLMYYSQIFLKKVYNQCQDKQMQEVFLLHKNSYNSLDLFLKYQNSIMKILSQFNKRNMFIRKKKTF